MYTISPMVRLKTILLRCSIILGIALPSAAQNPYQTCWSTDGWIIGSGGVLAISALVTEHSINPLSEQEISTLSRREVNAFDRAATYNYSKSISQISDVLVGLQVTSAAGLLLLLPTKIREDWRTVGIMSLETALWVTALPRLVKGRVQRIRPYVYNPQAPWQDKISAEARRSFFSGHTSTAFATAVFLSTVYGDYFPKSRWKPYLWSGTLLVASTIGFLRFESGKHFPTDILAGALVGSTIGYVIPLLHRNSKRNVSLNPASGGRILQLGIRFEF